MSVLRGERKMRKMLLLVSAAGLLSLAAAQGVSAGQRVRSARVA